MNSLLISYGPGFGLTWAWPFVALPVPLNETFATAPFDERATVFVPEYTLPSTSTVLLLSVPKKTTFWVSLS